MFIIKKFLKEGRKEKLQARKKGGRKREEKLRKDGQGKEGEKGRKEEGRKGNKGEEGLLVFSVPNFKCNFSQPSHFRVFPPNYLQL